MQKTIYLILILVFTATAYSNAQQNYPVAISTEKIQKVIGTRNGNLLTLLENKDHFSIVEFDTATLAIKNRISLDLAKDLTLTRSLSGVWMIGSTLKIVYFQKINTSKEASLCVYDCDGTNILPNSMQEFRISDWDKGDYIFYTSNPKNDCLLFGRMSTSLKNTEISFETFLINERSELLNSFVSKHGIAGESKESLNTSVTINDKHDIFFYSYRNSYDTDEKKFNSTILLKTYNSGEKEPGKSTWINVPKGTTCAELLFQENNNSSSLIGVYQNYDGKKVNGFVGLFKVQITETGELGTAIFSKYSDQTRLKTLKGAEITQGVSVRPLYAFHSSCVDSKDNLYILQERQTINSEGEFYYGSILVSKFDVNGNLLWDNLIPKSQFFKLKGIASWSYYLLPPAISLIMYATLTGTDEGYLSFKAELVNDEIQILFNDIKENSTRQNNTDRAPYTKPEKGIPYSISVTENGDFNYSCREDLKPVGEPFVMKNALYLNGHYYLVSKDKKLGSILSKVKF